MRYLGYFKGTIYWVILLLILCNGSSCHVNPTTENTGVYSNNEQERNNDNSDKDVQFIVNATKINLEEIQLSQLAQQRATLADVKLMGAIMEATHTKSLNALTELAKKKLITIPAEPIDNSRKAYQKLNNMTGIDFDNRYCEMMVDGHKYAVQTFEKASAQSSDTDIKYWTAVLLPDLRMRLDHAIACQQMCEKM